MKKIFLFAAVILLAACGKEDSSSSMVKKAISAAEEAVPSVESKNLGTIPSLQLQYKEAEKQVKKLLEEFEEKAKEEFKNGGSMEDALRADVILKDLTKETSEELKKTYKEKIMAEVGRLDGKAMNVDFDEAQFASANAVLHASADSSITNPFIIAAELKLARPLDTKGWAWIVYVNCDYMDANGEKIGSIAENVEDFEKLKAGDKVNITLKPGYSLHGENGAKLEKLYFRKQ